MFFPNYGLRKNWLNKSLNTTISEDPLTSNKVRGTKHCQNPIYTTFTRFIDHSESN